MGAKELTAYLDISRWMVTRRIRNARNAKLIHITRYERQTGGVGGRAIPIYAAGKKVDAKEPKRLSKKEVNRRYRERHAIVISAKRYPDYHVNKGVWRGLI